MKVARPVLPHLIARAVGLNAVSSLPLAPGISRCAYWYFTLKAIVHWRVIERGPRGR
jgi:hypothetical protein